MTEEDYNELLEDMRDWLDERTPETMRLFHETPNGPALCASPVLSPRDISVLRPVQREALVEMGPDYDGK